MPSSDTFNVNRYSLRKEFVMNGTLILIEEGAKTELIYKDSKVEIRANDPDLPSVALDNLRILLEANYQSLIGINGCRVDMSHGGEGVMCYRIKQGEKATENVYMFEPTPEVEKLCTIAEHEAAYNEWLESVRP